MKLFVALFNVCVGSYLVWEGSKLLGEAYSEELRESERLDRMEDSLFVLRHGIRNKKSDSPVASE